MKRMFDRNHISSLFAVLAACVALACPAAGQSRLDSLQQVEEVVVTGHVVRKEVIPVQELSGEQLHKLSSHNVARTTSGSSTTASNWGTPRTERSIWGASRSTTWRP